MENERPKREKENNKRKKKSRKAKKKRKKRDEIENKRERKEREKEKIGGRILDGGPGSRVALGGEWLVVSYGRNGGERDVLIACG